MGKGELTKRSYIYRVSKIKLGPTNILLKKMKFNIFFLKYIGFLQEECDI